MKGISLKFKTTLPQEKVSREWLGLAFPMQQAHWSNFHSLYEVTFLHMLRGTTRPHAGSEESPAMGSFVLKGRAPSPHVTTVRLK